MGRVVNFNSSNWELIYDYSASATPVGENSYIPIPPVPIPIFLNSDIIAVYVKTNPPAGRIWRFGGNIEQRFISGLIVGGVVDSSGIPRRTSNDKITILFFPKISASYSLQYYPPKWFKDVNLMVWQYVGLDDTEENISMAEEFGNVNFKLDQIITNLP
ncbi:MAG: hypothetical protein ACKPH3_08020 [Dolichospermum sp.]